MYYKDSSGVVQSIASKAGNSGSFTNLAYTGTLTGGTGIVNLGSGQFYKSAGGNVGIGTSSPTDDQGYTRLLDISSSTGGATYYHATGTSTYGWLGQYNNNITLGTNGASGIIFSAGATPSEKMRLNTNGNLSLFGGTTTATGVGVTFPATQSASSDANCLDDYEEGTWTPSLTTDGVNYSSVLYDLRQGTYVKVGKMVSCSMRIQTSSVTIGSSSGNMQISGLPFATGGAPQSSIYIGYTNGNFNTYYPSLGFIDTSNTVFYLRYRASANGADNYVPYSAAYTGAAGNGLMISFTYFTS